MAWMRGITRRGLGAATMGIGGLASRPLGAQMADWPSRPVRVVVPYGAGGATDTMCRLFCGRLATILGQPFPVENRPGGNAVIGMEQVLRAPKDGYTLLFGAGGAFLATPRMQPVSFDPVRDFAGISIVGTNGMILAVNKDLPARNLTEFVAEARAHPGRVNAGTSSLGTSSHLAAVMLAVHARADITMVPYPGVPQIMADLLSGRIQLHFGSAADVLPQAQAGNVRVLAVSGARRMPQLPDVPTVAETFPGATYTAWNGFFAPTGTPRPVIDLLARHIAAVAREPEIIRRLDELGIDADGGTPEAVEGTLRREGPEYETLLRASGLLRG
ncbi:Bug family tripartite tricarboxylate transporter substrate binding protein [Muricoccus radiodurans]|uniref:Bug family tripartite tricarboxylate transporter substrate binding protein n=1 Tax=Muricoccus radiodurans TaxID=2231721 RepID=UPI003CED0E4D